MNNTTKLDKTSKNCTSNSQTNNKIIFTTSIYQLNYKIN